MSREYLLPFGKLTAVIAVLTLLLGGQLWIADILAAKPGGAMSDYVRLGRDFVNVWVGGALALGGKTGIIYDLAAYREALWAALQVKGIYAYSYPPHSLFLAVPFAALPYWLALSVWNVAGAVLFVHAAAPWLREVRLPIGIAALFPASFMTIWAGHYGFLTGALALYGWRALDEQPRRAGFAFALMTVKPHLGVLVPVVLLLRRRWSAFAAAAGATVALVVLSALVFGPDLWRVYLTATLGFHADLLEAPTMAFHFMMPTTTMAALQLGLPRIAADIAQGVTAILALVLLVRATVAGAKSTDVGLIAGSAIFLVLPYAFVYDMTVHCLATLVFAARATGTSAVWQRTVLGLAFLMPLMQMPLARLGLPVAPLILLGALWVETRIARAKDPE